MKRMKLFMLVSALLLSVQANAEVGKLSKDELRGGEVMCGDHTSKFDGSGAWGRPSAEESEATRAPNATRAN